MKRKAQYEKALKHLIEASRILSEIGFKYQKDYDADRYAYDVSMIIESDNGESGLKHFIENFVKD